MGGLTWRMNFWKPGWMVANGAESLYKILLSVTILGLSNCSAAHALKHSTNQRERIVGSVLTSSSYELQMNMTVITSLLKLTFHVNA